MDITLVSHLISGQLVRASKAHNRAASERLKQHNLHIGQEMLLLSLKRDNGIIQSELAKIHGVDQSTITKVVQRMERSGLVERRTDMNDSRVSRVYLSDKGHSFCEPAWQLWLDLEKQLTEGLTEAECILLLRLLKIIATNLEK